MSRAALLYLVVGLAAALAGIVVPLVVHRSGSWAVPGWQALVTPGLLSQKHQFLAGQCEACHTPHAGVEAKNCIACHANAPSLMTKQSTRFHASIGQCAACHVEHEGRERRPVAMDHDALARIGMGAGSGRPEPSLEHLKTYIAELGARTRRSDPILGLDCAACHTNRDPHRGLFGRECASCHLVTSWALAGFRHPSPDSKDCAQCHQAPPSHYMMHFQMVSMAVAGREHARVEECHVCHQTDSWNNIRGVGWYKHH